MDPERWKAINQIFHSALKVDPGARETFVAKAAGGDVALAREVQQLLRADEDAGDYIEQPAVMPEMGRDLMGGWRPIVRAGDVLCGRFRLEREVGEGGMGQVFEAFDTDLGVVVAVKVIRPEIAESAEALARFRREVRLARRITHANVCRTFDLERDSRASEGSGDAQAIVFLTMEFLAGETLASRLARVGHLELGEALEIAQQVAAGLEAAHALGVVHRDIKPGNVMLCGNRAVITDFGLARVDAAEMTSSFSSASHRAHPIGTLAYMAPEQLDNGPVTAATDVYAFGLLLFEMVTGQRAFPSENFLSGIAQRLAGKTPRPSDARPDLPEQWVAAIEDCLRVNADERFRTAAYAVAVIEGRRKAQPWQRSGGMWLSPRRVAAAAMVMAAAMSLLWVGMRLVKISPDRPLKPGAIVYLAPVENRTTEKQLDHVTELLKASLAQSAQIKLLDQDRVEDTLQRMARAPGARLDEATAREVGMRNGAARVVFVSLSGSNGRYRMDVDVQEPDNTPDRYRERWPRSFGWVSNGVGQGGDVPAELLATSRTASDWIRKEVGESANDIARLDAPPEDVTTTSWEALAEYTTAEHLYLSGQPQRALDSLQHAVALEPGFALAYARMGDLAMSLGRTHEAYVAYGHALSTDFQRRLSRRELDRIRGIYAEDSWDYQTAEEAFRDYTVYYENDYAGWFFRALPLIRMGRVEEAEATLKKAYSLDSKRASAPSDLVTCSLLRGDAASANQWIEVLRQIPHPDAVAQFEGITAFLSSDFATAEARFLLLRSSKSPVFRLRAYSFLLRLAAERKDTAHALQWADQGNAEAAAQGNPTARAGFLADRAFLHAVAGDAKSASDDAGAAVGLDDSPETLIAASEVYGRILQAQGGGSQARAALRHLSKMIANESGNQAYTVAAFRIRTQELVAAHKWKEALDEVRRAANADMQVTRRDYVGDVLTAAAAHEPDAGMRARYKAEAAEDYARTALHPAAIWVQPSLYRPGALARDMASYLQVSGAGDEQRQRVEHALERMQGPSSQHHHGH